MLLFLVFDVFFYSRYCKCEPNKLFPQSHIIQPFYISFVPASITTHFSSIDSALPLASQFNHLHRICEYFYSYFIVSIHTIVWSLVSCVPQLQHLLNPIACLGSHPHFSFFCCSACCCPLAHIFASSHSELTSSCKGEWLPISTDFDSVPSPLSLHFHMCLPFQLFLHLFIRLRRT